MIADTHGRPHPESVRLVAAERPDAILHAGDIGDSSVLETFGRVANVLAVRGNIDGRAAGLPDALEIEVVAERATKSSAPLLKMLLVHIGVNGPKLRADVARSAQAKDAQLVICGHSHVPFIGRDRGVTVFNPGSVGPRRFSLPIVFGMLELAGGQLRLWHVDCESGLRWAPP